MPSNDNPGPFADVDKYIRPIVDGFWWLVSNRLIILAIIVAGALGLWAAMSGNRTRLTESRSRFGAIVATVACIALAIIAVNFILGAKA